MWLADVLGILLCLIIVDRVLGLRIVV